MKFEKDALGKLQALYGDTGVSADGRTAYVPTFRGMVFALDTGTGNVRWVRNAGAEIVGGVAVDGDTIYFGTKANRLFSLDATSGEQRWAFKTKGEVWATPAVEGDTIYVTSLDGSLYALDKTGQAEVGVRERQLRHRRAACHRRRCDLHRRVRQQAVFGEEGRRDDELVDEGGQLVLGGAGRAGRYRLRCEPGRQGVRCGRVDRRENVGAPVQYRLRRAGGTRGRRRRIDRRREERSRDKLDLLSGQPADGGAPVELGVKVLANLTSDGDKTVYVVPSSATLYVLDATAALGAPGSFLAAAIG